MKKSLLSLAALATLAFATPAAYNYEITPTIGGVLPEGNLDLKSQLTYGLRFGINLDNSIFNQVEFGYDRSDNIDYKAGRTDNTDFNRYYANIVKEYKLSPTTALYSLIGIGYEDLSNEQLDNKDGMFAQYGGGVKYWVTDNFALKAEVRHAIKFDFDKSSVKPEFMPEIQKVADFMKQNKGYKVVLEGHTDSKGSDAYNMKLSDQRAKAVAKALETLGVSAADVTTEAYGESKPIATNDTEAGRAENRRVDALFKK